MNKEQKLIELCVKKECEIVGVSYNSWTKKPRWFALAVFTPKEYDKWKKFCISKLTKFFRNKKFAEREFAWLDLMYGFGVDR